MLDEIRQFITQSFPPLAKGESSFPPVAGYHMLQEDQLFLSQFLTEGSFTRPRCGAFIGGYTFFSFQKEGEPFKDSSHPLVEACSHYGCDLRVYDVSAVPARSLFKATALLDEHVLSAMAYGMTSVEDTTDMLAVVNMSPGYELACVSLLQALGVFFLEDDLHRLFKDEASYILLEKRLLECAGQGDALDMLREFGGYEIASMIGAVMAAKMARIPVFLEGLSGLAVVAVLERLSPGFTEHCFHIISEKEKRLAREVGCHHVIVSSHDVQDAYPYGAHVIHFVDTLLSG